MNKKLKFIDLFAGLNMLSEDFVRTVFFTDCFPKTILTWKKLT